MKKIAVIICGMEYHNQQELLQGIIQYNEENGGRVFVFLSNTDYRASDAYKKGAFRIYDFMNPEEYDGVILLGETIHYQPAHKYIAEKLQESGVPVLSVSEKIQGMGYIGFDVYKGMEKMVEHIIREHGAEKIAYIHGSQDYEDAVLRAQAFRDTLERENLVRENCWFYQGDFNLESGMDAVQEFERMHRMPEAIVCSNDSMAAGAILQLQDYGYRVPEDVLVTGFDDVCVARDNSPRITTVRCDRKKMGYLACEYLMTKSPEEIRELSILLPTEQIYAGSCGCPERKEDADELKRRILRKNMIERRCRSRFNELLSQLVAHHKTEDFIQTVRKFVPELHTQYFYVAFRDMELITRRMIQQYRRNWLDLNWGGEKSESYSMPIAYEKGEFSSYTKINRGQLLPGQCMMRGEGAVCFVMPMHYQEQFFGYCIVGNCEMSMETEILSQWLLELGNCIESILEKQAMQNILEQLNRISSYDKLTGLCNRLGFQNFADEFKTYARTSRRNMFMCFADIDGLKKVNDTYGHNAGDMLIKSIADCLRCICRDQEVCMRFGGDEFVVLGLENVADSRHLEFEQEFQRRLEIINVEEKKEYPVSASIGSYVIKDIDNTNLQVMLDKADMEMYLRKKAKKRKEDKQEIL